MEFDAATTRRLALGLLAASGAMLFAALQLIGSGISADNSVYAAGVSKALNPLAISVGNAFFALICAELAEHPKTPEHGHPHSRRNYLQTGFVLLVVAGLGHLIWGSIVLLSSAAVP